LYDQPASGFVAGFVGDSNILSGTLREARGSEARVDLDGGGHVIGRVCDGSVAGDRVEVFLRPESLRLGAAGDGTSLTGRVESLLFNGASSRVLLDVNGQLIEVADPEQASALEKGATASVGWTPERARIFARRSA
jgi:spermidine/putrescine transport system ATP-binding protein